MILIDSLWVFTETGTTGIIIIGSGSERRCDASRAVEVKLVGWGKAPAAWHTRLVLPSVAADEGNEAKLRNTAGMSRTTVDLIGKCSR